MKFLDKRGLELAASTIIILLVSIAILGFSMSILYKVVCGAEELTNNVNAESQRRLNMLLSGGARVEIADNTKVAKQSKAICPGPADLTATVVLGIKNIADTKNTFEIQIERTLPTQDNNPPELQYFTDDDNKITIPPNSMHTMNILFSLKQPPEGKQYVYTVKVLKGNTIYGAQQFYIEIPE